MPRLARFHGAHPELDIQIMTSFRSVELEAEDVDMASWIGVNLPPGVSGVRLFDDEFMPVCSPALLNGSLRLKNPSDLVNFTLLKSVPRADYWKAWLTVAGEPDLKATHSLSFGSSSLAIQAAIDGVGVALVQHAYIKTNLSAGTLVAPFDIKVHGKNGYYLGWSAARPVSEAFALFRDWIIEEVNRPD